MAEKKKPFCALNGSAFGVSQNPNTSATSLCSFIASSEEKAGDKMHRNNARTQ